MALYTVQWYDYATSSWRKFGLSGADSTAAKIEAFKLWQDKEKKIDVRVSYERIIYELSKVEKKET